MCSRDFGSFSILTELGTLGQSFYILYQTSIYTHTYIHTHGFAKNCGFSFVSNNSIVVMLYQYLSRITYNFRKLFRGIRSIRINRRDQADDLFSRNRKRPFLRLPRMSILTFCPESRSQTIRPTSHQDLTIKRDK